MTTYRPMTSGGGAFLVCVGIALLIGAALPGDMSNTALICGFVAGVVGIVIASIAGRRLGLPRPATRDILIVWACIAAEMFVFLVLAPHIQADARTSTLFVLAIVGLHFLPMAFSFGALIFWLGVACIAVPAAGFFVPAIPLDLITLADALLKLGFGLAMLAGLMRIRARTA